MSGFTSMASNHALLDGIKRRKQNLILMAQQHVVQQRLLAMKRSIMPAHIPGYNPDPEGSDSETDPLHPLMTPMTGNTVVPEMEKLDPKLVGMSVGYKSLYSGTYIVIDHQVICSDYVVSFRQGRQAWPIPVARYYPRRHWKTR